MSAADRSAIQLAYAQALASAADGYAKAIADLKANLQQQLAAAGKDKTLIAAANSAYKSNFAAIFQAYSSALSSAKQTRDAAFAAKR